MKEFMDKDFLLETKTARKLYKKYAKGKPIVDFHNHLSAKEIYENKNYENITQVWLGADHYKWRAMRSNGIDEELVTGNAKAEDKFKAWAATLPRLIGSPLYHWNHLEMQRFFGYDKPLNPSNAREFWRKSNSLLKRSSFRPRNLLAKMNVIDMCTTDDPADDLKYHILLQKEEKRFSVRPTFRPEKAMGIDKDGYREYIRRLEAASGVEINSFEALCNALKVRMDYFEKVGCTISDHSIEGFVYREPVEDLDELFNKDELNVNEVQQFKSALLVFLGKEYAKRGWIMQLHIGALRNNSTRRFEALGADVGCDSADDFNYQKELSTFLNILDRENNLPRTIIYNLNAKDTFAIGSLIGNFQDGGVKSKVQLGAAWWLLDSKSGMENQLRTFAELGVFANFVGMVTDSRSMLSFPRHEYFRRILCNYIGNLVEKGEYPDDEKMLGEIIEDICYRNIIEYQK